uniref:Transthyretin-like family protein n=1 Tax=Strongyloides papillosus TaxID=174720 RepID=A0A0N5BCP9_STREA
MKFLFFAILGICFAISSLTLADQPKFADSIMTRATSVKGVLYCGNAPHRNAHVYLMRDDSDAQIDILDKKVTGPDGTFVLEGHTGNRESDKTDIHPMIKIYHKCDEPEKKKGFRYFRHKFPRKYVTLGRVSRKTYDIGRVNLEIVYPKETRVYDLPVWEPISKE